ncbi:MAG: hypothetical protein WCQ91_07385, partial [Planctomycetota bacterium]
MDSQNRFVCRYLVYRCGLLQWLMCGLIVVGLGVAAETFSQSATLAQAQESPVNARAALSASDARRVFVSGVPDTFDAVRAAIAKAKNETGRDYRVIVVGNGSGGK